MDLLKNAVIHSFKKESGANPAQTKLATSLLDTEDTTVTELASQLTQLLGKNENTVLYGQFSGGHREGMFPSAVKTLTEELSAESFKVLTHTAMSELASTAERKNFATGGYICFIHFQSGGRDFLLVAMVKERGAFTVNEKLVPTAITQIDLSKLHQAARINLATYAEVLNVSEEVSSEDDDDDKTYLCFIKSGASDVADYFQDALGCVPGIGSARATKAVIREVRKFVQSRPSIKNHASEARRSVIDYLHGLVDGTTVQLDNIVDAVRKVLPVDLAGEVDGLKDYLNSEKVKVPSHFSVHSSTVKEVTRIRAKGDNWQLTFDDLALGETDAPITYDWDSKRLTINKLDQAAIERIETTLRERSAAR